MIKHQPSSLWVSELNRSWEPETLRRKIDAGSSRWSHGKTVSVCCVPVSVWMSCRGTTPTCHAKSCKACIWRWSWCVCVCDVLSEGRTREEGRKKKGADTETNSKKRAPMWGINGNLASCETRESTCSPFRPSTIENWRLWAHTKMQTEGWSQGKPSPALQRQPGVEPLKLGHLWCLQPLDIMESMMKHIIMNIMWFLLLEMRLSCRPSLQPTVGHVLLKQTKQNNTYNFAYFCYAIIPFHRDQALIIPPSTPPGQPITGNNVGSNIDQSVKDVEWNLHRFVQESQEGHARCQQQRLHGSKGNQISGSCRSQNPKFYHPQVLNKQKTTGTNLWVPIFFDSGTIRIIPAMATSLKCILTCFLTFCLVYDNLL